ncbi:hypothetical protein D3C81_1786890 [compost metagenome]
MLTSTFMPAPGCSTLTIIRPTSKATVLMTSKYSNARPPVLPTFFMSSIPAIPITTVQKMTGAIIILISLIKPSPSGFIAVPVSGRKCPSRTPMMMATMTCAYRDL